MVCSRTSKWFNAAKEISTISHYLFFFFNHCYVLSQSYLAYINAQPTFLLWNKKFQRVWGLTKNSSFSRLLNVLCSQINSDNKLHSWEDFSCSNFAPSAYEKWIIWKYSMTLQSIIIYIWLDNCRWTMCS